MSRLRISGLLCLISHPTQAKMPANVQWAVALDPACLDLEAPREKSNGKRSAGPARPDTSRRR